MLNNAQSLQDLRVPPGNRLEELAGDRRGQHSIRVNDQWQICFVWRDRDAYEALPMLRNRGQRWRKYLTSKTVRTFVRTHGANRCYSDRPITLREVQKTPVPEELEAHRLKRSDRRENGH